MITKKLNDCKEIKKIKLGKNLFPLIGSLKKDIEWEEIEKDLKKRWKNWSKRYNLENLK